MKDKTDGITLMESSPVAVSILRLSIPMMLGSIAQMVYNMTDTFFIGQTGDPNMVAGVSLTMPLFMFSQGLGNIFAVGASSYISRMLGAKRLDEAKHTSAVSFYVTIALGLAVTLLLVLFRTPILHIVGTSDITFRYASDYFTIISTFIAFAMVNIALGGQIRSEGASAKATVGMMIGIVVNIILDPLFILALNLGVAGAAWATVIGLIASTVYYVRYFLRGNSILSIKPADFKPNAVMFKEVLKIGVPSAVSNFVMTLAMIITNVMAAGYGDFVVAGSGVNGRITSVSFMLVLAIAFGYQPFAGFNYGAKNIGRLEKGLKITLLFTTTLALFFTLVFFFFGKFFISLFIQDGPTIEAGSRMMRAFLIGMPFLGVQVTFMATFQALGKAVQSTIINLGRQFIIYLPLLYILNSRFGFSGFIYTQPVADIVTTVVSGFLSISLIKNIRRLPDQTEKEEARG